MVTTIGLNSDFHVVLKDLIALDYDAAEAYQAAIDRLETQPYKQKLSEFRQDHLRHIQELTAIARTVNVEPPSGPDAKVLLAKGKVVLADLMGDKAILMAMKTNEDDTNTAYERAFNHKALFPQAREVISRAFADERLHRAWIIETISKMNARAA